MDYEEAMNALRNLNRTNKAADAMFEMMTDARCFLAVRLDDVTREVLEVSVTTSDPRVITLCRSALALPPTGPVSLADEMAAELSLPFTGRKST